MTLDSIKDYLVIELSNDIEGNFLELLAKFHEVCLDFHNKEVANEATKQYTINQKLIYDTYRLAFSFLHTYYEHEFWELPERILRFYLAKESKKVDKTAFEICKNQTHYAHTYFEKQRHDPICVESIINPLGWLAAKNQINIEAIILHYSNIEQK